MDDVKTVVASAPASRPMMVPSGARRSRRLRVAVAAITLSNLALLVVLWSLRGDDPPDDAGPANPEQGRPLEPDPDPTPRSADPARSERAVVEPPVDPRHPLAPLLRLHPYAGLSGDRLLRLHDPALLSPVLLRVRHAGLVADSARAFADGAEAGSVRLVLAQLGVGACGPLSERDGAWIESIVAPGGRGWIDGRPAFGAIAGIHALRIAGEFERLGRVVESWLAASDPANALDAPLGLALESLRIPGPALPARRLLALARERAGSPRVRAACFRLLARSGDEASIRAMLELAGAGDAAALAGVSALADEHLGETLRSWFDGAAPIAADPDRRVAALRALLRSSGSEDRAFLESFFAAGARFRAGFDLDASLAALDAGEPDPLFLPGVLRLRARFGDDFLASLADRSAGTLPRELPPEDRARLVSALRAAGAELVPGSLAWTRAIATLARFSTPGDHAELARLRPLATDPELRFRIDLALGAARDGDYDDYLAGRR